MDHDSSKSSVYRTTQLAYRQRLWAERKRGKTLTGIEKAVEKAGGVTILATRLGARYQAVQGWLRRGYPPPNRVVEIASQFEISRDELVNPKFVDLLDTGMGK